jgi:UDP-N-acetylglucosamine 2-epimerase (non-hydrolysing)
VAHEIVAVVGARPNYMKIAPIWRELQKNPRLAHKLVHTGQHYDDNMSKVFFDDLKLPEPDVYLGVGSGSHADQVAKVMVGIEPVLARTLGNERPRLLIVVGDVNSTMACTLVAAKMGIPVAHVEAGLRSFDRGMPEEINRMVTDILADLLFTTEPSAKKNLLAEGIDERKIYFVGNVMIDSLHYYRPMAERSKILADLGLQPKGYGLVTLHRPSNVDDSAVIERILNALIELGRECPLIFPAHPRTTKILKSRGMSIPAERMRMIEPVGYLDFMKLMMHSRIVLTDSGGIQEETTVLGIPCLTIRENTERPVTIDLGTNRLVGMDPARILSEGREALRAPVSGKIPELWDGKASERIAKVIDEFCQ